MSLAIPLEEFRTKSASCAALISRAYDSFPNGVAIFDAEQRSAVVSAGFLRLFVAWESFLETVFLHYALGNPSLQGKIPNRYVIPRDAQHVNAFVLKNNNKHFDFGNHDLLRQMTILFFENGEPFEPHLGGVKTFLDESRTLRHSAAQISSSTQRPLEALALKVLGTPRVGISLHAFLMLPDPRTTGRQTVFEFYQSVLLTAAQLVVEE